jgi:hypothetical protein
MALSKEEIKKYLEADLFEELKLDNLPLETKAAILSKLADVVYLRMVNTLMGFLDEEDLPLLEDMMKRNAYDEFNKYIQEKVPNWEEILSEIIAEEKKRLIEFSKI